MLAAALHKDVIARISKDCISMQCAGLRLIPGATKSGLQKEKTPERKLLEFFTGGGDKKEE